MEDENPIEAAIERERGNRNLLRWWLYFVCLMILVMVVVGGATRLTDSGLSITEWKPVHGIIPPLSAADWHDEFEKYRQIPEYQLQNAGMSLDAFKTIFWWEWGHRFLGRMIGLVFAIPLIVFWLSGRIETRLKPKLLFLLALGGLQGFIGWWMVKSGLVDRVDVSQYRLAVHLTLACVIFAYAFWIARGLAPHTTTRDVPRHVAILAPVVVLAILAQVFLGGLVAGLDAGLASNEWPKMLGEWVPAAIWDLAPIWLNWFENPISVQFNHRLGGYLLFVLILAQAWVALRSGAERQHKRRTLLIVLIGLVQLALGILTVLWEVPLHAALAHQAVAVVLLAAAIAHWRGIVGPYSPVTGLEVRA